MVFGNAWHTPTEAKRPATNGMRSPAFPNDSTKQVTIFSGNQFQGGSAAGNQLRDGSALWFRQLLKSNWTAWQTQQMEFVDTVGNDKFFSAAIPVDGLPAGTQVQYYIVAAYAQADKEITYLRSSDATGLFSATSGKDEDARKSPFNFTIGSTIPDPSQRGQWGKVIQLPNVAAHAHLLWTGKILMWGRRDNPKQSMNTFPPTPIDGPGGLPSPAATCTPFLFDPVNPREFDPSKNTPEYDFTPQPTYQRDGPDTNANLFCSGHTFLPDGSLLVVGGHEYDGSGANQSSVYIPEAKGLGKWKPGPKMLKGRWYPTVTSLGTGAVLVTSGSYGTDPKNPKANTNANIPEIWTGTEFVRSAQSEIKDLYPRMHVAPNGLVFAVSLQNTLSLNINGSDKTMPPTPPGSGTWNTIELLTATKTTQPAVVSRPVSTDYGCSVMYDTGKVLFVGGSRPPDSTANTIDLAQAEIGWIPSNPMNFPRRQHNATILPDGTVLVTGGTRGNGDTGQDPFNDLSDGRTVHDAELWDPRIGDNGSWKLMASEQFDRCYHATAVLVPDGRILSAGGGEFQIKDKDTANLPKESYRNAQFFSPPYLCKPGTRPSIISGADSATHGANFEITTTSSDQIKKISLIGLSSVTHSINTGQRLNWLDFKPVPGEAGALAVTAPSNPNTCPPGYYMLFALNEIGKPSIGKIMQILPSAKLEAERKKFAADLKLAKHNPPNTIKMRAAVRAAATGTRIEIGIESICPYGLSACWGAAHDALGKLDGVEHVDPMPHSNSSSASVYMQDNGLPVFENWRRQFYDIIRATYGIRGFEATLKGFVELKDNRLFLIGEGSRPDVELTRLEPQTKIQWDRVSQSPQAVTPEEADAYDKLVQSQAIDDVQTYAVTGPVSQTDDGYRLQVRLLI
ncbi:DUF1929-domain-containing protein [Microthyrium microscopicum]|uniref:DUF1929-domain-containing protein n=1 Tax=Microthyrium microscopicum TaxID=703497 RepID=A0A6A6U759_9PEZI|nr:DUF1929-domain-containing protein [Microthyrium microscopicum]